MQPRVEGLGEDEDASILVLVKVYINGEEVRFDVLPGIIYETTIVHPQCFDTVSAAFKSLTRGNLEWEAYKPLMSIKERTEVTYVVEIYVDRPLLSKNATIYISIRPPYIAIHQK